MKITIDNKPFTLTTDWNQITFAQYVEILKVQELAKADELNELEEIIKLFCIISDNPTELEIYLDKLTNKQFLELQQKFDFKVPDLLNYTEEKEFLEIGNKKYKIKKNYDELTLKEMKAIPALLSNPNNILSETEIVFGVMLREVSEENIEKPFSQKIFWDVITHLRDKVLIKDIYKHLVFFSNGENKSGNNTVDFSIQED